MTAAKIGGDGSRKGAGNFKFSSVPKTTIEKVDKGKDKGAKSKPKDKQKADKPKKSSGKSAEPEEVKESTKQKAGNKQALAKTGKGSEKTAGGKGQKGIFSIGLNWW